MDGLRVSEATGLEAIAELTTIAAWHTVRFEESPKLNSRVEVILALHEVKIPLIDLFAPRRTSAEKDYYEGDFVG